MNVTDSPLLAKEWERSGAEVVHQPCDGGQDDHAHRVHCGCSGDGFFHKVNVVEYSRAGEILRDGRFISAVMAEFGTCCFCNSGVYSAVASSLYYQLGRYYRVVYNPSYGACSCCGAV